MVLRILSLARHAGWLALAGACAASIGSSACSNSNPPAPDAFVAAVVGGAGNPLCNLHVQTPYVEIGTAVAGKPVTVQDGDTQTGTSQVQVACSVTTAGNGFDVNLNATLEGPTGGSVTITSPGGQGAVTSAGGSGISGVFQSPANGIYRQQDCTITFTYNGSSVPDSPPIAAGRIWGHLSCPKAVLNGATTTGPDGGAADVTCDGEADFLFEQCGQ